MSSIKLTGKTFVAPGEKQYRLDLLIKGEWVPANQPEFICDDRKTGVESANPFYRCRVACYAYNRQEAKAGLRGEIYLGDQQWRIVEI